MALSAVSSISAGGYVQPFRSMAMGRLGQGGRIERVEAIPALAGREDTKRGEGEAEAHRAAAGKGPAAAMGPVASARLAALDPRSAGAVLSAAPKPGAGRDTKDSSLQGHLDELLARRASMERSQAERKEEASAQVLEVLSQLKSRDTAVRAHEAAHMAAGGRFITGGATYTYEKGPDGGEYAVGGEVGIDTSPVPGDPEATVEKMRVIQAAALAPSDPSAADLSVAAAAAETEAAALAQIAQNRAEELAGRYRQGGGPSGAYPRGASAKNGVDVVA
jgi:hypothetical protein